MAPPIVCASTYHPQDGVRLWSTPELPAMLERLLDDPTPILGHGFAYDACCWLQWYPEQRAKLWRKYEEDKVLDSISTERIIEISTGVRGKLSLDELARRYGVTVTKSSVRTDFGRYMGAPISAYSAEHVRYATGDAAELHTLYRRQRARGIANDADIADLTRGDLWLRLASNYGVRTDPARVHALEESTQAVVDDLTEAAQSWGGMRKTRTNAQVRDGGWYSRDMKAIRELVAAAYDGKAPRTDGGQVSTAVATLEESGDPRLEAIAELGQLLAVRNKDVPMLRSGVDQPIHARMAWAAATTRSTCSSPNLQNFRRKAGIRECLMPRPGCCYVASDYPGGESFTLAQFIATQLGRRTMLNDLNAGKDLHAVIGASILGCTYEELQARRKAGDPRANDARQAGKYGNFGLTGFMTSPETFAFYVNQGSRTAENPRGLQWSVQQAQTVIDQWNRSAHDQVAFLNYVKTLNTGAGWYDVQIPGTTIMRRGCSRTAAANSHFQGYLAKVARVAGWRLAKCQYITGEHPGRTVLFTHDEYVSETAIGTQDLAARVQERCMVEAVNEVCPDVRIRSEALDGFAEGAMMLDSSCSDHYSKNAKHKRDSKGSLVICQV
jgi:hypothetical protein